MGNLKEQMSVVILKQNKTNKTKVKTGKQGEIVAINLRNFFKIGKI